MKLHGDMSSPYGGRSNTLQCVECNLLTSVGRKGTCFVQHDTAHVHAKVIPLDGEMKSSEGCATALCL